MGPAGCGSRYFSIWAAARCSAPLLLAQMLRELCHDRATKPIRMKHNQVKQKRAVCVAPKVPMLRSWGLDKNSSCLGGSSALLESLKLWPPTLILTSAVLSGAGEELSSLPAATVWHCLASEKPCLGQRQAAALILAAPLPHIASGPFPTRAGAEGNSSAPRGSVPVLTCRFREMSLKPCHCLLVPSLPA